MSGFLWRPVRPAMLRVAARAAVQSARAPAIREAAPVLYARSAGITRELHNTPPRFHVEPRLQLTFTCSVPDCGTRSTHEFTKHAYNNGIVIVQCPGCKNRHLIADNLGWFTESKEPKTVEEIVAAKGGRVQRGTKYDDGKGGETIEIDV